MARTRPSVQLAAGVCMGLLLTAGMTWWRSVPDQPSPLASASASPVTPSAPLGAAPVTPLKADADVGGGGSSLATEASSTTGLMAEAAALATSAQADACGWRPEVLVGTCMGGPATTLASQAYATAEEVSRRVPSVKQKCASPPTSARYSHAYAPGSAQKDAHVAAQGGACGRGCSARPAAAATRSASRGSSERAVAACTVRSRSMDALMLPASFAFALQPTLP